MSEQEEQRSTATTSGTPPIVDVLQVPGDLAVGDRVGPYRLLQRIGEGGFGVVYIAEQESPIRRRVALKVIKPGMDTREVIARFEAERQALAMMGHPGVAAVYDAGATAQGRPYFVMEYVQGESLTEYCDKHRLSVEQRLGLFVEVCGALHHAHSRGIIHRDLKPSNILVTELDGRPVPKVIDFGVAKATNQRLTEKTIFTEQGRIIGTPEYMSPEQAEMTGLDVDGRTDVYSLGVILYELLTGTLPLDKRALRAASYEAIQRMIREVEPPRPSTRLSKLTEPVSVGAGAPGTSPAREVRARRATAIEAIARDRAVEPATLRRMLRGDLDWITMKALEKERARRHAGARELAQDILKYLRGEPVTSGSLTFRRWMRRVLVRRSRLLVWVGASVLGVVLLAQMVAHGRLLIGSGDLVFLIMAAGILVLAGVVRWAVREIGRARREAEAARAQTRRLRAMLGVLGTGGVLVLAAVIPAQFLAKPGSIAPGDRDEIRWQEALQRADLALKEAVPRLAEEKGDRLGYRDRVVALWEALPEFQKLDFAGLRRKEGAERIFRLAQLTEEVVTFHSAPASIPGVEMQVALVSAIQKARAALNGVPAVEAELRKNSDSEGLKRLEAVRGPLTQAADSLAALDLKGASREVLERRVGQVTTLIRELGEIRAPVAAVSGGQNLLFVADSALKRAEEAVRLAFPDQSDEAGQVSDVAGFVRAKRQSAALVMDSDNRAAAEQAGAELKTALAELEPLVSVLTQQTDAIGAAPAPAVPPEWAERLAAENRRIGGLAGNSSREVRADFLGLRRRWAELETDIRTPLPKGDSKRAEQIKRGVDERLGALAKTVSGAESAVAVGSTVASASRIAGAAERARWMIGRLALGYLPDEVPPGGSSVQEDFLDLRASPAFEEWVIAASEIKELDRRLKAISGYEGLTDVPAIIGALRDCGGDEGSVAAEVLVLWNRLAGEERDWPAVGADLGAAVAAMNQVAAVLSRVPQPARRAALEEGVRAQARALWTRYVGRVDWEDEGAVKSGLDALSAFGASSEDLTGRARFNYLLYEFRTDLRRPGLTDDSAQRRAAQFVAEIQGPARDLGDVSEVGAALKAAGEIAGARIGGAEEPDFSRVGPGTRGWAAQRGESNGVATVVYRAPGGGVQVEFAKIDSVESPSGTAFVSTTEVSLETFVVAMENGGGQPLWPELRGLFVEGLERFDPRLGPHVWVWEWGHTKLRLSPAPSLEDAGRFDLGNGWLERLPHMAGIPSYPPDVDGKVAPPGGDMPMQQVTPGAAVLAARALGCRLPTSSEWAAALAIEELLSAAAPGEAVRSNLRDPTWMKLKQYSESLVLERKVLMQPVWPDDGIFLPTGSAVPKRILAQPATETDDGVLWLTSVGNGGGVVFKHLVGNVAEFVCDNPAGIEVMPALTAAQAEKVVGNGASIRVIGVSALSPKELVEQARTPLPLSSLAVKHKSAWFSDVGFRLAFSGAAGESRALVERAARAVSELRFIRP